MSENLPAVRNGGALTTRMQFDREQVELIKSQIAVGATDGELKLFLYVCGRRGLDPLTKQIYAIKRRQFNPETRQYEDRLTIQTAIDGYRLVAYRTGKYAGRRGPYWTADGKEWQDVWLSSDPPKASKCGVLAVGDTEPTWHVVTYDAYCQKTKEGQPIQRWKIDPAGMLGKCAEAGALRVRFPEELSGLHTDEEMGRAEGEIATNPTPPANPQEQKDFWLAVHPLMPKEVQDSPDVRIKAVNKVNEIGRGLFYSEWNWKLGTADELGTVLAEIKTMAEEPPALSDPAKSEPADAAEPPKDKPEPPDPNRDPRMTEVIRNAFWRAADKTCKTHPKAITAVQTAIDGLREAGKLPEDVAGWQDVTDEQAEMVLTELGKKGA